MESKNVYNFSFTNPQGKKVALDTFRGNVLLIVNTASQCGFTKQYEGLKKLYQKYQDRGFIIIGIPSNDFGNQEPGSDEDIQKFCNLHYSVSFPIMKKERVRGNEAHPFYLWAKKELGFWTGPKWNFHKYLINRTGKLVDYFHSTTTPENQRLVNAVEKFILEE